MLFNILVISFSISRKELGCDNFYKCYYFYYLDYNVPNYVIIFKREDILVNDKAKYEVLFLKSLFPATLNGKNVGLVRELNPGPRAPEARIIPLDQRARYGSINCVYRIRSRCLNSDYLSWCNPM